MTSELFALAEEIRAIASTGLHYAENAFDRDRYQRLMNQVIREGVKTKVLMLSATPVNRTPSVARVPFTSRTTCAMPMRTSRSPV